MRLALNRSKPLIRSHDAAKESNLPSRGLPGPASFEDRMGHQARAAPLVMLRPRLCRVTRTPQAVLQRAFDAGLERVDSVEREGLR